MTLTIFLLVAASYLAVGGRGAIIRRDRLRHLYEANRYTVSVQTGGNQQTKQLFDRLVQDFMREGWGGSTGQQDAWVTQHSGDKAGRVDLVLRPQGDGDLLLEITVSVNRVSTKVLATA